MEVKYEIHYFDKDGSGYGKDRGTPWIYDELDDESDIEEAISFARDLIREGFVNVEVFRKITTLEKVKDYRLKNGIK